MSGRLEQEAKVRSSIDKKLAAAPKIVTSFYNWMDARDKSFNTIEKYIEHVMEFIQFYTKGKKNEKFYEAVTDDDIERYMISIRKKIVDGKIVELGDSIRAAKWSSLNTFFNFLVKKKYIEVNPVAQTERPRIKTKKPVVYMVQDEIKSVFDRIEKESPKKLKSRDTCIVALGLCTGLRVSAIVNINIEDIDFRTNVIRVVEKGKKAREIKFADNFKIVLLTWLKDREVFFDSDPNNGPLFISLKRQRLSVDSVQGMISKYTSHLPKHITPHKLRSSAAMNLYSSNVGVLTIASLLGHENITTTQRYISAFEEEKENATNILDKLF